MATKTGICSITNRSFAVSNLIEGRNLRPHIISLIKADYPDFNDESLISFLALNKYRKKYLEDILTEEVGALSKIEKEVIESINENELLSENIEWEIDHKISIGDKIADKVAEFGGSWTFVISFFVFVFGWMAINIAAFFSSSFDPYPFILLNLILSCLAAIQAPIIMMSQNRKESRDRKRSEHDYKINLKAELEIRLLHEKMDHLLAQQNKKFIEVQQIQMDLMEDILNKMK